MRVLHVAKKADAQPEKRIIQMRKKFPSRRCNAPAPLLCLGKSNSVRYALKRKQRGGICWSRVSKSPREARIRAIRQWRLQGDSLASNYDVYAVIMTFTNDFVGNDVMNDVKVVYKRFGHCRQQNRRASLRNVNTQVIALYVTLYALRRNLIVIIVIY